MTASDTRNPVGEATSLQYVKTTHCTSSCTWFSDSIVPSIHGQWLSQSSSLSSGSPSKQNYSYDEVGRLVQVQSTPAGKGCTTRVYEYDKEGDRTSLVTHPPGAEGACSSSGRTVENHQYDGADRLTDAGTSYNAFGDITELPGADAGGSPLSSAYYTDGQLQSQTQTESEPANDQTIGYNLDPARRTRETISTGKVKTDVISHYAGPGNAPNWMSYTSGEWTREIPGITGNLDAMQYNTETPVLQIANLHGDIVGTASESENATKLLTSEETTEFGVPTTSKPPKYSWLGAGEFPTELSDGVIAMGARSYVPEIGRFLQPDPQPGGSADPYSYTNGDPLNESDPTGEWTLNETSGGASAIGEGEGSQLTGGVGVAEGAIMPTPVNTQIEEAFWANPPWDQLTAGTEEYEEYENEEWEEEEVAYHPGGNPASEEAHVEQGLLYQPLAEKASQPTRASLMAMCSTELHTERRAQPHGACMAYVGLFGELKKFGGELVHGAKKVARSVVRYALSYISHHIKTITSIVAGCDRGAIEGSIGGGIGGAIFAPFVGPETIPIGAIGGGAGGCIVGSFEAALGI